MDVLGYAPRSRLLLKRGLGVMLEATHLQDRVMAARLLAEHEMEELFTAIQFARSCSSDPIGLAVGDRTHRL